MAVSRNVSPKTSCIRTRYSPETDALGLELADRPACRSQRIGHGLSADLDATGQPVGLTVEHWSAPPHPLGGSREAWAAVARALEEADPLATRPR